MNIPQLGRAPFFRLGERVQLVTANPETCGEYTVMRLGRDKASGEYAYQLSDLTGFYWKEYSLRKVHAPSDFVSFAALMKNLKGEK